MVEQESINATAFGRVLGEFMESRGISPEPEQVRSLAQRSGLDPDALLGRMSDESTTDVGHLVGLADELGLSMSERHRLAHAFSFEEVSGA